MELELNMSSVNLEDLAVLGKHIRALFWILCEEKLWFSSDQTILRTVPLPEPWVLATALLLVLSFRGKLYVEIIS